MGPNQEVNTFTGISFTSSQEAAERANDHMARFHDKNKERIARVHSISLSFSTFKDSVMAAYVVIYEVV